MEIIIRAHLVHKFDDIESFSIKVNELNRYIVKKRLELEYYKLVDILRILKEDNQIKSIFIPKNKKIQPQLDKLVTTKRDIKRSIQKLRDAFN